MSALTGSGFYVQIPGDEHWNVEMPPRYVIEAGPIDVSDSDLRVEEPF